MRRSFLVGLVPVLAFAAVSFASTREAHAGPIIGLDFDLGTALNSNGGDFSTGGGLRLGYRFGFRGSWLYVQPEIGGKFMAFGVGDSNALGYDHAGIVNAGLKLGLSGIVQPNIFGHLGLGILAYNDGSGNGDSGYIGPAADVGAGIDFRIVPGFLLGAQAAFNSVAVPSANSLDAARWVTFGINATFHIGEPRPRPVYVQPVYYRRY